MDAEFITVTPAAGYTVLNDVTMLKIPKEGQRVRRSAYWDRLAAEGAVTVKAVPKPEAKPDVKPEVKEGGNK